MSPISLYVEDEVYRSLKTLAKRTRRPVSELIREAMSEYIDRKIGHEPSLLDLPAHPSGDQMPEDPLPKRFALEYGRGDGL